MNGKTEESQLVCLFFFFNQLNQLNQLLLSPAHIHRFRQFKQITRVDK